MYGVTWGLALFAILLTLFVLISFLPFSGRLRPLYHISHDTLVRSVCRLLPLLLLAACDIAAAPPSDSAGKPGPSARPTLPLTTTTRLAPTTPPQPTDADLAHALALRAIGNDEAVGVVLSAFIERFPTAAATRTARFYLAESYAHRARWTSAVEMLRSLANEPPDSLTPRILFWLARGYEEAGDWANAVATYTRFRDLKTPIEPYAALRQATQLQVLGRLDDAVAGYEYVTTTDIDPSARANGFEHAIALRSQLGQADRVLELYRQFIAFTTEPAQRAHLMAEAIPLARQLGQPDQARRWLLELVATFQGTPEAANAAAELIAAGDPDYTAANAARAFFAVERYPEALDQLDLALTVATPESLQALHHLRALTLRALARTYEALDAFDTAIAADPASSVGRQARLDRIQTLGQNGDAAGAAAGYRAFAADYPADPQAPEALDRAAIWLERLGDNESALEVRLALGQRYPQSDQGQQALHSAALTLFERGNYATAQSAWETLANNNQGYERARGFYWAARCARQLNTSPGLVSALFDKARSADPASYYGARAADELEVPRGTVALDAPITANEWGDLAAWVTSWPAHPPTDPAVITAVATNVAVQRAVELEAVGLYTESLVEWNALRTAWADAPDQLVPLARVAYAGGAYSVALRIGARLQTLAPADAPEPPSALRRILYPTPYPALVADQAHSAGLDPRLLYALLRQESHFDPRATSWVGARGLAQVMPTTAEGIAQRLAVNNFQLDDLYRPYISVRFGAFYLGQRINDMEGSVVAALSAYNGGLGNAMRWANGTYVADPDLFTERIDFIETENYVKSVYGFYNAYRSIYVP